MWLKIKIIFCLFLLRMVRIMMILVMDYFLIIPGEYLSFHYQKITNFQKYMIIILIFLMIN